MEIKSRSIYSVNEDDVQPQNDEQEQSAEDKKDKAADQSKKDSVKDQLNQLAQRKSDAKKAYDTERQITETNINALKGKLGSSDNDAEIKASIVKAYGNIRSAKSKYEEAVKQIEGNAIELNSKMVDLDGDIMDNIIESTNIKFAMNLFESVSPSNKTEILADILYRSFEDVSCQPDMTQCKTIAKNAIGYMNREGWSDGKNHWDAFWAFIENTLTRSAKISLSKKDMSNIYEWLNSALKENSIFAWAVFGESEPGIVAESPKEPTVDESSDEYSYWEIDGVSDQVMDSIESNPELSEYIENGSIKLDRSNSTIVVYGTEEDANSVSEYIESMEN